jgi:hypothetical protein
LTAEQRESQCAQLMRDLLKAERAEEAVIDAAYRDGLNILRRKDADPRAVLGLSDALPAPGL